MSFFNWDGVLFSLPAVEMPLPVYTVVDMGEVLAFTEPSQSLTLPVTVPRLVGMDELVVTGASLQVRGVSVEQEPNTDNASQALSQHDILAASGVIRYGALNKIVISGFNIDLGTADKLALSPEGGGSQGLRANDVWMS